MKGNSKRFVLLYIVLFGLLFLSSFVSSILNYFSAFLFLGVLLIVFKFIFGFEKDRHRYIKDISLNVVIILMSAFLLFYISGLVIGFERTEMQYSWFGLRNFLIPYILYLVVREILRYQMLEKSFYNKKFVVLNVVFFVCLDVILQISFYSKYTRYEMFLLFALVLLPSLSKNISATYISHKVGFKPNLIWVLFLSLYSVMLPIVPKTGEYILSLLKLAFPLMLVYHVYSFFKKRDREAPLSTDYKHRYIGALLCTLLICVIIYFTSGYFRYYVVAVATGSMVPTINVGDVVLLEQNVAYEDMDVGDILVYRYENRVIVHRIERVVQDQDKYYFYTKGDANNAVDNYVIYEDMVLGIVRGKIPFVGYPTVWLNELL